MGMVVQHNMNAINAYNALNANVSGLKKASEKLSSGYRINRAGDDAAGLAVSEKMRSQIKGLNQAIRNSQDGINMIQTFEGAAQETHSILQRMKELATESANGTYDNATDRAAMQLEFDQLNDELNQIADTDFNGTIVLNGGVMSDGLKQVDGDFDYANKQQQVIDSARAALQSEVDAAQKAYDEANEAVASGNYDLSSNGDASQWNTVDDNAYDKTAADKLWKALGIKDAAGEADTSEITKVSVTFTLGDDGETWTATSGVDNMGNEYDAATVSGAIASSKTATVDKATGYGGVSFTVGEVSVNAIFDAVDAKAGDTITLDFTNVPNPNKAPTNIGFADDSVETELTAGSITKNPTISIKNSQITDDTMTADIQTIYDYLQGAKLTYTFNAGSISKIQLGDTTITSSKAITVTDAEGNDILGSDGKALKFYVTNTDGTLKFSTYANSAADKTLFEITAPTAEETTTKGTLTATIALDTYSYDPDALKPDVEAGDDPNLSSSGDIIEARDAAANALAAAKANQQTASKDYESAKAYLDTKGVSIADSFDNSTARLLYTENITLQTGARSKDAVNFTFNYNDNDQVDMRGLQSNLDISARANGLNTENLNISTADDANYAMDQIDKAINKVSMVRANFGAIQNRLEHKINNLTVTNENLTEAESSIRDTDMASEMMNYTKYNILQQAAQSMLAQANQQPQSILQLLG